MVICSVLPHSIHENLEGASNIAFNCLINCLFSAIYDLYDFSAICKGLWAFNGKDCDTHRSKSFSCFTSW